MSTLERLIEEAPVIDGKIVVWDSRGRPSGTRLEIEPAPLSGHRALMQDNAGICTSAWLPDCTKLEAAQAVLGAYLDIVNRP